MIPDIATIQSVHLNLLSVAGLGDFIIVRLYSYLVCFDDTGGIFCYHCLNFFFISCYNISYLDEAPTFTMPTVKASIPDHTVVDTSVIDFYFTDADDYADYYVDYGPDYSSAYFYFDTSKCKANLTNINIFCLTTV